MYIRKLEVGLEWIILVGIVIIIFIYVDGIVYMVRCIFNFDKQLSIFKDFNSNKGMFNNIDKTKVTIVKFKKDTPILFIIITTQRKCPL